MKKIKTLIVFGTRPEVIKLYPLIYELKKDNNFELKIVNTGQHKEMVDELLDIFKIEVDYSLKIMVEKQTLEHITEKILEKLSLIVKNESFDLTIVQGDTTTAFVASLVSFYNKIPIAHVEAGLRTKNIYYPFPEEMNRTLIGKLAKFHFAPTEDAKKNLLSEGVNEENIFVTGNTIVDALLKILNLDPIFDIPLPKDKKIVVVTAHRRENWDSGIPKIANAIKTLSQKYNELFFVIPVHKNPIVREKFKILKGIKNVLFIEPLNYIDFIHLLKKSFLVLSDSGGIQEEIPTLKKPLLLLRNETEREEAIRFGFVKLVGTDEKRIIEGVEELLREGFKPKIDFNPFGDGKASERIKLILKEKLYGSV
ncbi:MAG: UDP-N-acetylglucosamine 2-epimerase (non-hydrolyzing) [Caldisericia bacterium]|nr:UDP-N-acetylglucosamine 2-epimerase (non-hydrolyzing) [Caldisericia bacterium]